MVAIRLQFLTGRCVATAFNDRQGSEWPPHPNRLFSALFAVWAEGDQDKGERAALDWLCNSNPTPAMYASPAAERSVMSVWVPVNDVSVVAEPNDRKRKDSQSALHEAKTAYAEAGDQEAKKKALKAIARAEKNVTKAQRDYASLQKRAVAPAKASNESERNLWVLPANRKKQERTFPSVTPHEPSVYFVLDTAPGPEIRAALRALCRKLVRVGHSSSLVACDLVDDHPDPNWHPDDDGEHSLRVPISGQCSHLESAFALHRGVESRVMPSGFQRYRNGAPPNHVDRVEQSVFSDSDWIVFRRIEGHRLPITRAVDLATALRGALMKHAKTVPALLSGHTAEGAALQEVHGAFVALPFVGSEFADGSLLGVALVLPRAASEPERNAVLAAVAAWEAWRRQELQDDEVETPPLLLHMGRAGALTVERVSAGRQLATLRPKTWSRAARVWRTATPVALDKNPGPLTGASPAKRARAFAEAEAGLRQSVSRIGLPQPADIVVLPSASMPGTEKARRHPRYPAAQDRSARVKVHVELRFDEKVAGPVLLGAGRYRGLGLFRPLREERGDS